MERTNLEQVAAERGYPSTLFGFTPNQEDYWREPGLPWFVPEEWAEQPASHGLAAQRPLVAYVGGNSMAPRFPEGCGVGLTSVQERQQLVVGRVYCYSYRHAESGEREMSIARLTAIGANYLEVAADNHPTPAIWLLADGAAPAVQEVTHYVSYPIR